MACSTSLTNDEIKDRIQNIWSKFVLGVEPDRLSDWLVQENVITSDQWQRILTEHPTRQSRCRALLHFLNSIPHPRAFLVVYQYLTEDGHYLLESIDSQQPGLSLRSQSDVQAPFQGTGMYHEFENDYMLYHTLNIQNPKTEKLMKQKMHQLEAESRNDKRKIQQLQKDNEEKRRAWGVDKDRLLIMQKDLEIKLNLEITVRQRLEEEKKVLYREKEQLTRQNQELQQSIETMKRKMPQEREQSTEETRKLSAPLPEIQRLLRIESLQNKYKNDPVLVQTIKTKAAKENQKSIYGLAILDKELFVVSEKSSEIEVYDSVNITFSRRWTLKDLIRPLDLASCSRNKCLYINDYKVREQAKEILRVDPNGNLIKKWSTGDDYGDSLFVTDESNIILTVLLKNRLNEYSPDGQLIREINLSSDAYIRNPSRAIKLTNGQFVVSHGFDDDELHRVCIVDGDGKLKKLFGGKCGSYLGQLNYPISLSVDGDGFVMVADRWNNRVLLLDSDLEFKREILSKERQGLRRPLRILLDDSMSRVFVADNELDSERKTFGDGQVLIFDFI